MSLPSLPPTHVPWSPNIRNTFRDLNEHFSTCHAYLQGGGLDKHRLKQHTNMFMAEVFPMILILDEYAAEENLPLQWLEEISNRCLEVFYLLDERLKAAYEE